jgi:hypothetical protein
MSLLKKGEKKEKIKKEKVKKLKKEVKAPENTIQFLWMIIVGIVKSIPKLIKKKLIKLIIIFIGVLLLNTYLLAYKNEGYNPTPGNKWLQITAVRGNIVWVSANWTMITFFTMNIFYRIKENGLKNFFIDFLSSPKLLFVKAKESKKSGIPTFFITTAIVLLITIFINNKLFLLLGAFMVFMSFTKRDKGMLLYFFALLRNDLKKIFKLKGEINKASTYLMVFSIIFGFIISYFIKRALYIEILSVILIALAILYKNKKISSKAISMLFVFFSINFIYFKLFGRVYADDFGANEAGGTLGSLIKSPGGGTAVKIGLRPAAGSVAGVILADGIRELSSILDSLPTMDEVVDGAEEVSEEIDEAMDKAADVAKKISNEMEEGYDDLLDSEIVRELGLDLEAIKGMFDGMFDENKSINDIIKDYIKPDKDGVPSEEIGMMDDIVQNGKWYSDTLDKIMGLKSVGDGADKIIADLINRGNNFKGFMKNMVENGKKYDYVADLLEGHPNLRLGWMRKSFQEMKDMKAFKIKAFTNILGKGLTTLGGVFDLLDNYGAGDELAVAASKAVATTATMVAVSEAGAGAGAGAVGAQLAAFELANHLLFGGSTVADIASPTKMIKGAVNYIADYGGMDKKKLLERVESGYYGENIKNMIYSKDMAKDLVKDPKKFYDDVCDFTDADKDGWNNMNKTVDEMFKLPKAPMKNTKNIYTTDGLKTIYRHPLDSVRRVATDAGWVATKGVVKVGEGWAYIGKGAGEFTVSVGNKMSSASNWIKSWF